MDDTAISQKSPSHPIGAVSPKREIQHVFGFFKQRRRNRLRAAPFPVHWLEIIEKNVRFYACLPEADRLELQGLIQIFLHEKTLEGCGGLVLTDEIKVTVAAGACLLLLHRDTDIYPKLTTVLVYPSAYIAKTKRPLANGLALEGENVNLGESWPNGIVVLSWDEIRAAASDIQGGKNLVLHEFAHQLDREDGAVDGTPFLEERSQYVAWARVLGAEYERLKRDTWMGRPTVLDEYGTTDPAEFFAVATECFFEKPRVLGKRHPELYAELKSFYRQDPAELLPADRSPYP
jgi:Mlc titration factor MtfA (ptsG expression regulator)